MIRSTLARMLALAVLASSGTLALSSCKVKEGKAPVPVPEGLAIPVEVEGNEAGAIDSGWLSARAPDYADADRRAWSLQPFLQQAGGWSEGAVLEVVTAEGRSVEFRPTGEGLVPVLMLNREGEPVVKLLDPKDPFPKFHGRGGNRGRQGEDDRVRGVARLRIRRAG